MADSTFAVSHFLGGEISKAAQGRFDKPDYRYSLKACFNAFPTEIGNWTRRPGTKHAGTTRGGAPGRVVKFDFEQAAAVTLEFTDGILRIRSGTTLLTAAGDSRTVQSISSVAVVQLFDPVNWQTGDTLVFLNVGAFLADRQFLATRIDSTHFSIRDAITGVAIDGGAIGPIGAGAVITRVRELVTAYTGQSWSGLRAVQAETTDILLTSSVAPQALTVTVLPSAGVDPDFAIAPAVFTDGPYLDPFINGVQAVPSGTTGIISLALQFAAYDATKAYALAAFATVGGVNYVSLADQNLNNAPAGSPASWAPTSAGAAINGGKGFLGSDVGRLVRLLSEPAAWVATTGYSASTAAAPVIVSYNPSGVPGASLYYSALQASTGKAPGSDLLNWQLVPQGAAIWTWGKITSLSNLIDRALAGSVSLGDMSGGGGLNAAFDGNFSQLSGACAANSLAGGAGASGQVITFSSFVGKNYAAASDQKIDHATVYPSSNQGFCAGTYTAAGFLGGGSAVYSFEPFITLNLRGSATPPSLASAGTLLGSTGQIPNTTAPLTINSGDIATAWKYVWIEQVSTLIIGGTGLIITSSFSVNAISEVSFFSPSGTGSSGVNIEILGPPLLRTAPILTWRLGVYSNTTGWPTCGLYYEGRLWLGGAVKNRFDASVSNGITGATIDFAPTNQYGAVAPNNAISYTLNSDSANQVLWMKGDAQGVFMGTQASDWLVFAPTAGSFAPNNISGRPATKIGSANIEPARTEHTLVFVKRYARKLIEYFADANFNKPSGQNLADKAEHIVTDGIAEIAYTEAVTPILWGRDTAGALFGVTYKRDTLTTASPPTFAAWHRHALGSGRVVESLCVGPSTGGDLDTLTMVTNDPLTNIRHVEILTDAQDETAALANSWYLDNALAPVSTVSTEAATAGAPYGGLTLNGFWHLNGETVQVFAGGVDCGDQGDAVTSTQFQDFVVINGAVFVPYGDGVSAGSGAGLFTAAFVASFARGIPIVVGFTYESRGHLVRPISPADSGARNGPAFAKLTRNHRYGIQLINALGVDVGTSFDDIMYPALFRQPDGTAYPPPQTVVSFTGIHQDALHDDYDYDRAPCWRVTRPYPATVAAIGSNLATQDQ
jgi:hypothetical protein